MSSFYAFASSVFKHGRLNSNYSELDMKPMLCRIPNNVLTVFHPFPRLSRNTNVRARQSDIYEQKTRKSGLASQAPDSCLFFAPQKPSQPMKTLATKRVLAPIQTTNNMSSMLCWKITINILYSLEKVSEDEQTIYCVELVCRSQKI